MAINHFWTKCSNVKMEDINRRTHEIDKSFNKRTYKRKKVQNILIYSSVCVIFLWIPFVSSQWTTRDPRWYSREGDFKYKWPNPGDPEYR